MRILAPLIAVLLLAACGSDRDSHISRPVTAGFTSEAAAADEIEVRVTDRQPVETAELVAPDGTEIEAFRITRDKTVVDEGGGPRPSVGVGVFGGSSGNIGTSVGIGFPIFGGGAARDPSIDSRALIRVPDMAAYRSQWQDYRVRLRFGAAPENERVMEIPAPRPPEG